MSTHALAALVPGAIVVAGMVVLAVRRTTPVAVEVEDTDLRVSLKGKDVLFALCREIRVPLSAVAKVAVVARSEVPRTGLRLPGTSLPGLLRAGSYGTGAKRDFWLVRRAQEVLVIELAPGQPYRRLVLELPDPSAVALGLQRYVPE